jgi:lipoate-protein ligase A
VLIGQTKVCGSAQRRRNGAVLQHGSLLWRTSPSAPELPGVLDVAHPIESDLDIAADLWLGSLARRLGFAWQEDGLEKIEVCRVEALAESRYAWENWTKNRGRAARQSQEML